MNMNVTSVECRVPRNSNSHFDPERGCVVPTSRSTSAQHQVVLRIHGLRLALRTQPRSFEP